MDQILDNVGVLIIRYLSISDLETISKVNQKLKELCESALLWRSLLSSFNPRTNKDTTKEIRIRTIAKRPESKLKKTSVPEKIHSKQWIFIPPDLERQIKVITINKAQQLRKNEEFKTRCLQVLETWTESISRTLKILQTNESCGDTHDPYSSVTFWKDKIKIIEEILEELNDICVAKIDAVFNNLPQHKNFINQIERVKKNYREAKVKKN